MQNRDFSELKSKAAALLLAAMTTFPSIGVSQSFRAKEAFQKPLIAGASVSADYGNHSPGKTLALRYTTPDSITTKAYGGRPGRDVIKEIKPEAVKGKTICPNLKEPA